MNTIDVCLSPDLIHKYNLSGKIVVIVDILRATSCITTGLAVGVKSIVPVVSLEKCKEMKSEGFFIAGERGGQKVDGFDIGNSPFSYMEPRFKGSNIAITTTNGTVAIEKSADADLIIIGSFLNISAVAMYVMKFNLDVIVFCAGWKGRVSIEDTLFAGALAEKLEDSYESADDSVLLSKSLYQKEKNNLLQYVENAGHAKRLRKFNVIKDIEFCLSMDTYNVVPVIKNGVIQLA